MTLLVIGLNHRTAPVEVRERCALSEEGNIALTYQLNVPPVVSAVILTTCNRLEIYADVHDADSASDFITRKLYADYGVPQEYLYCHEDQDVTDHLLQVACGLDSMVLGEAQILGQVASAYQLAQAHHPLTPHLHRLFTVALTAGKRAHTETDISKHTTSVSHAALSLVTDATSLLVIGAGEMAYLAAQAARDSGRTQMHIVNRTYESALSLAQTVNATAHTWSDIWDLLAQVDCVICATGAPHTVLQTSDLERVLTRRIHPLSLIDIALPRDVEPSARELPGLYLYDLDDVQTVVDANLRQRSACVPHVERIIHEEIAGFMAWWHGREIVPTIAELRRKVQAVAQAELQDTLNRLTHLDAADRQHIERLAHRLVNKILHDPTVTLHQRAIDGNAGDYSRVLRELFALLPTGEIPHAG